MTPIPITFCLMTSTRGHFDVKTRYLETIDSFAKANPLYSYAARIAHIKVSPGEEGIAGTMAIALSAFDQVITTLGEWKHGTDSHQSEYIRDLVKMSSLPIKTPYIMMVEDDWAINTNGLPFVDLLQRATDLLASYPDILQVRFPRYSNEAARINNLMNKHGIEARADRVNDFFYVSNDFSMNPAIYRTRDLKTAALLTQRLDVPKHIEHGTARILKAMSQIAQPFAFFDPEIVRIGHRGTKPGDEDDLSKPLIAT